MSSWGWKNRSSGGFREQVPRWLRALSVAVPWLTVGLLFQMICLMGGALTSAEGVLFALPERPRDRVVSDVGESTLVALLQPTRQGTLVFFDDTRYVLEDDVQMARFAEQLKACIKTPEQNTLLAMADIRISWGDLYRFRHFAMRSGIGQILFAEKKGRGVFE